MTPNQLKMQRDAGGRIVHITGPGLVDIQVNGYAGVDFCGDPEALTVESVGHACRAMRRRGSWLAASG